MEQKIIVPGSQPNKTKIDSKLATVQGASTLPKTVIIDDCNVRCKKGLGAKSLFREKYFVNIRKSDISYI